MATADKLAEAVSLDMTAHWRPTVRTYLGRVTKARILEAVREAVSDEAADRMADMKKQDMAEAAEQLLAANRLAARADADTASRARARRGPAGGCCHGGEGHRGVFRRRRVDRHGRDRSRGPGFLSWNHRNFGRAPDGARPSSWSHRLDGCPFNRSGTFRLRQQ